MKDKRNLPVDRVVEFRCRSNTYLGAGAIQRFPGIMRLFKKKGIERAALVTGRGSYKVSGAWDVVKPALEDLKIEYAHFDRITGNPTVDQVDEATRVVREIDPQVVIGIGGGSPLDSAKGTAILLKYPDKDARQLYRREFTPTEAVPNVLINLTHGTGTEMNRFAVATIPETNYKLSIAYDYIYPVYSIDDPTLSVGLPADQTRYVSIDALNHVNEAATTIITSPYAILLAKETVQCVTEYLPVALAEPGNIEARYYLHYAAAIAGIAFDCARLHITHALEHTLSAFKPEVAHGLGLAVLQPAVIRAIYPAVPEVLAEVYKPIAPELRGLPEEAGTLARKVEEWLFSMGVTQKLADLGFTREDIPELVKNVRACPGMDNLLSLSPVRVTDELIARIYEESLYPMR
jgi:alcohol dehydrogenase class IV